MFNQAFFTKHQKLLLWLLNTPVTRAWFRKVLRIETYDFPLNKKIGELRPNMFLGEIRWKDGQPTQFFTTFTYPKYGVKLHVAFYPIWKLMHIWDYFADVFTPKLSFGFDAFTEYPDTGSGGPTGDGTVVVGGKDVAWATLIADPGTGSNNAAASRGIMQFIATATTDQWSDLSRAIFSFPNPGGEITAATLSVVDAGRNGPTAAPDINVYAVTPAAPFNFVAGDFNEFGSTPWSTAVTYAAWTGAAYKAFIINPTGIAAIATGIAILGMRNANYDVSGTPPPWGSTVTSNLIALMSDNGSNEPKLSGTFTPAPPGRSRGMIF